MRMQIKVTLMVMAAVFFALALYGCGGDGSRSAGSNPSDSSGAAAGGTTATSNPEASSPSAFGGKVLVAYFSATGNTAPLARYAAEALGADLYEIVPTQPYTSDDLNYNDESARATVEQRDETVRPAIEGSLPNMDEYDTIVLAHPIWWGEEPRIMDTFVEGVSLDGKTVATLCTSGGSGIEQSIGNLSALAPGDVTWLDGHRFAAGASKSEVEAWLGEIGLLGKVS